MAIPGGGRARRCVLALTLSTALGAALSSCNADIDQAQSVQTRIGRIPGIAATGVSPPSGARAGAISVDLEEGLTVAEVLTVVGSVARAAETEDYVDYRLTLREEGDRGGDQSTLVVDGDLALGRRADAVVTQWRRLESALLGTVTYTHQPDAETITVTTPGGLLHDVVEAARIGYGTAATTWRFADGGSTYVDDGRIGPRDVLLVQRVQRTVASPSLPLAAPGWRLGTHDAQVLLDLPVAVTDPVDPADFTLRTFARPVRLLVEAAVDALDVPGRDLVVRILHDDDVVGWWGSARPVVRGRDPLHRGWDVWLGTVAGRALAGDPS
ncbi:hypothetical protein [Nocardioides sp.]|uniref:hypothetical protein n=1 Tax=Nocardioides sp. TaxID=35761 RepID=UPI00286C66BE|nr:hypothetical protein [Nocardioides sp.]